MKFICRGTACIYRNGPPQSFWGLFGWFSAGVEVQYLLQLFPNWVSVLWRRPCLWLNGADDGLRYRARFGLSFESSCVLRSGCRKAFSGFGIVAIYDRSGDRGIAAAGVLYVVASGKAGFDLSSGFASNGYAEHSPGGYSLIACFVAEVVLTFFFLIIIMGATDKRAPAGFALLRSGWD